jgi:hypothetical protein
MKKNKFQSIDTKTIISRIYPSSLLVGFTFLALLKSCISLPYATTPKTILTPTTAIYYIDSSLGSDSNPGSLAQPWKTISKVNSQMSNFKPGDYVLFKRGESWILNSNGEAGSLNISASGSVGKPITFGAYGSGNLPVFDGSQIVDSGTMSHGLVTAGYILPTSYVTIKDLDMYNGIKQNLGLSINSNVTNIILQNCIIHTNRTDGFSLIYISNFGAQGSTNNIIIRDNFIYDSKWNGIRLEGGITNVTISGNKIHQVLHNGIDTYPSNGTNNKNFEIYNNNIYDFGGRNGAGIYIPGTSYFNIHDNDIHDALPGAFDTYGIKAGSEAGYVMDNITVRNNRIWNVDTNNSNSYGLWFDRCTDCTVLNNTLYANTSTLLNLSNINFLIMNNLAYANIRDENSMKNYAQDPKFIDATAGDFHLQTDSPACTGGVNSVYIGAFPCQ